MSTLLLQSQPRSSSGGEDDLPWSCVSGRGVFLPVLWSPCSRQVQLQGGAGAESARSSWYCQCCQLVLLVLPVPGPWGWPGPDWPSSPVRPQLSYCWSWRGSSPGARDGLSRGDWPGRQGPGRSWGQALWTGPELGSERVTSDVMWGPESCAVIQRGTAVTGPRVLAGL